MQEIADAVNGSKPGESWCVSSAYSSAEESEKDVAVMSQAIHPELSARFMQLPPMVAGPGRVHGTLPNRTMRLSLICI